MEFKKIELSDKENVNKKLAESDFRGSEYCFSSSYNWRKIYGVQLGYANDMLVIKCTLPETTYSFPAGKGNLKMAIEEIINDAKSEGIPLFLNSITEESKSALEEALPGLFEFTHDRDTSDYIYSRESLTTLTGKKLQSKRNHINKFKETYPNWVYENISAQNIADCLLMNSKWCKEHGCADNEGLLSESCAVKSAFENFEALGLKGGLLRCELDDDVVAYTMGTKLNSDTFIVHIEKAFGEIQGAYQMINQQFVTSNCQDVKYVNREDDTGSEGLRKAKLSYKPVILLDKYSAVFKESK